MRTNQTYWGVASDSYTWRGDANSQSSFAITSNTGTGTNSGSSYNAILGASATDAEVYATGSLSSFSSSNFGDMLRWVDGNTGMVTVHSMNR